MRQLFNRSGPFLALLRPRRAVSMCNGNPIRNTRLMSGNIPQTENKDKKLKSIMEIPSPPKSFFLGHGPMFQDPENKKAYHKMYKRLNDEYGDIVRLQFPTQKPYLFFFNPEHAREIYSNTGKFVNNPGFEGFRRYRLSVRPDLYPENRGLLGSQEEEWYETRIRVQQDMLRLNSAMFYINPLQDIANDLVNAIKTSMDANNEVGAQTLNTLHLWAFEAISYIFLNTRFHCLDEKKTLEAQQMVDNVNIIIDSMHNLLPRGLPLWLLLPSALKPQWFKKFDVASEIVHKITKSKVEDALNSMGDLSQKSQDEMSILEKLLYRNQDIGSSLATVMAADGIMAGVDTTGNTLAFLMYHLASHPEKQEKLYQEIVSIAGTDPSVKITEAQLNKMRYLKASLQESQRILPVVLGTSKVATEDCEVAGYDIKKGTALIQIGRIVSNLEKYHRKADQFIPERWLRENKKDFPCPSFSSIPFGHGPRMCIGRRFATLEIHIAAIKLLQNFRLEYNYDDEINTLTTFVNKPDKPLKIAFKPRN